MYFSYVLQDLFSFSSTTLCSTHDLLNCKQCYSTNATEGDAVCEPKGQSADTVVTECKGQRPFSLHGTAISQPHIKVSFGRWHIRPTA